MPDWKSVNRAHVLAALEEHDRLGPERFLDDYGFGSARGYTLRHDGKAYDSKAILGVAHRHATGRAATSAEFNGGRTGAVKILAALGFEVTDPGEGDEATSRRDEKPIRTCPRCNLALPASGVCDNCD